MQSSSVSLLTRSTTACLICRDEHTCETSCILDVATVKADDVDQLILSLHGTEYPGEKLGGDNLQSMQNWFHRMKRWKGFLSATSSGELTGHVRLTPVSNDYLIELAAPYLQQTALMEVTRLFVRPEYRGQGIAQQLLTYATDYAEKESLTPILRTADYLHASHALYRKNGWKQIGTSIAQYSGDKLLIFIKPASPATVFLGN